MNKCDVDLCQALLDGRLSDQQAQEFEEHLEQCNACRIELERASCSENQWRRTQQWLRCSKELSRWDDVAAGRPCGDQIEDFTFLAPTDDPDSMGRIGTYEVIGLVGHGGMGVVFKAVDGSLNRNVAIKMLEPTLSKSAPARQRFEREAKSMAAVSHENVVPIYAVDEHQGLPYFVMEYVSGGTLESRLRTLGSLDVISVVRISHQVARGLAAAHASGLVHRDVNPANILLDRGTDRVRVADFGLARVADDASLTRSGMIAGTPQYMSPEQIRGDGSDARSDLFGLGALMYSMCVGHSPFRSETVYGTMQRIVHDEPTSIRKQNPTVPKWLEHFVVRLLAKSPNDRFESAARSAELLEAELAHLQNPTTVAQPARRWMRPRRTSLTSKALGVSLMTISVVAVLGIAIYGSLPAVTTEADPPSNDEVTAHAKESPLLADETKAIEEHVEKQVELQIDQAVHVQQQVINEHVQDAFENIQSERERALEAAAAPHSIPASAERKWTIERASANELTLTLETSWGESGRFTKRFTLDAERLTGFPGSSYEQAEDVHFRLVGDSGILAFTGVSDGETGAGSVSFEANPEMIALFQRLGLEKPNDNQLITILMADLSRERMSAFVDELRELGFSRDLNTDRLVELVTLGVDVVFLRQAQNDFGKQSLQQFITIKAVGVTQEFCELWASSGVDNLSIDDLITLKATNAQPADLDGFKELGLENVNVQRIIAAKFSGLDASFVKALQAERIPGMDFEKALAFKVMGITIEFVNEVRDAGFSVPSARQLVALKAHNITTESVRRAKQNSDATVTLDSIIQDHVRSQLKSQSRF